MATPRNPLETFIWGSGGRAMTPEQVAREREIAAALTDQGADFSPVGHWLQGAARLGHSAAGAFRNWRADEAESAGRGALSDRWSSVFGGGAIPVAEALSGGVASPALDAANGLAATADMQAYRDAIASIESAGSGDYAAVGPKHPKLGRALGRYQIMEANIGPWSREALGQEITPEQFMANPKLQDAIFDHRFGQYVKQFGPEGAAQAWFAGPGGVGKMDRRDSLGTTVSAYTDKFSNALGGAQAGMAGATGSQGWTPYSGGAQASQAGVTPSIAELLSLSGDPNFGYASPAQQQIVQALMGQQLQQQDPAYQQQLAMRDLQMQQLQQQMGAPNLMNVGGQLYNPDTGEWIAPPAGPASPIYEIINGELVWLDPTQQSAVSGGQFGSDSGFTLSPGQTRYGAGGEAIASLPAGPESLSENERQINALVARGFSQAEAEDLAYGFVQTVVDPVLESPMIVNRTTGEGRYITPEEASIIEDTFPSAAGGVDQPSPAPAAADPVAGAFGALDGAIDVPLQQQMDAERPTLWDISGSSTGIVPSLQEGWTNVAGQFGASGFEDVVENRQMFDIEKNNLIRALSINPRFPVGEMERLEREINITPSAFNSANAMRARMIAINSALSTRLENELRAAADPNMPASARRNAIQAANDISNFLTTLGVPEGANAATGRGANDPAPENRPPLETFVRQ